MHRTICRLGLALCCLLVAACQKKPALAPAADPLSAVEAPPMGGTTYNDELKKELSILSDVLNQKVEAATLTKVKSALMSGDMAALSVDKTSYENYLMKVLLTLPELVHMQDAPSDNRKLWYEGKYLFLKRRFVEAATKMTDVLNHEPDFVDARNWRARAIFFLGNPDKAISELNLIIKNYPPKSSEALDARYLIGAIIFESNDMDKARIATGIDAWQKYLDLAEPNQELGREIISGLAELKLRKEGKTKPAINLDPFQPNENNSAEKNAVMVAFAKDEFDLALRLADDVLKKSYDNAVATIKARTLFKKGQFDEAAALYLAIVTKDKTYAPGFHYQGMAFMIKGEPEKAIAAWKQVIAVDPNYAQANNLAQRVATAERMVAEKSAGK